MKPGQIYNLYMRYEGLMQGGKERPAIIMFTDNNQAIAVVVKVTGSKPTRTFPDRIPIINWRKPYTGLNKASYAEISTYQLIPFGAKMKLRGELHYRDFEQIVHRFNEFYDL